MSLLSRLFGRSATANAPVSPTPSSAQTAPDFAERTTAEDLFAHGVALHQRGDLDGAARCYEAVLRENANFAPGCHLLGAVMAQRGEVERALALLTRSIDLDDSVADVYADLGNVYRLLERFDDAQSAYQDALGKEGDQLVALKGLVELYISAERPTEAEPFLTRLLDIEQADHVAHFHLANIYLARGERAEGMAQLRAALALQEAFPEAHHNLAAALHAELNERSAVKLVEEASFEEAKLHYARAVALNPQYADAHCNYAQLLGSAGEVELAKTHYRAAVECFPDFLLARRKLAQLLLSLGDVEDALEHFNAVLAAVPDSSDAYYDLALALEKLGRFDDAAQSYEAALRLDRDHASARSNLGTLRARAGALAEGAEMLEAALELNPEQLESWSNLGAVRQMQADLDGAVECYERALALDSEALVPLQNRLSLFNYRNDVSAADAFSAHVDWAQRFEALARIQTATLVARPRSNRRLRIGYVSPDFRTHSVAFFLEPILAHHDRDRFELLGFANVAQPDNTTRRLRGLLDGWFDISKMDDAEASALMRSEEVDILVDLAGHSVGNRLGVFARRSAPVQVTYLGYPNTTGLREMDYRISDPIADPVGSSDQWCVERLARLPNGFLSYQPPPEAQLDTPASRPGPTDPFTFVSFNELLKMNDQVVSAWSKILREVPQAKLLLKGSALGDQRTRESIAGRFEALGVEPRRLQLLGRTDSLAEHLALYGRGHLGLDTFPYNGTTTTCEALWMGVPVLTILGDRHSARVGASLMHAIDESALVCASVDDYVERAIRFAKDPASVGEISKTLRQKMSSSVLMQPQQFTGAIEAAYEAMWDEAAH